MQKLVSALLVAFVLSVPIAGCAPSVAPSATVPSISISPVLPTASPEPTAVPSPTLLPGEMILPVDTLGNQVPWLELDKSNIPGVQYVGFNTASAPFNSAVER